MPIFHFESRWWAVSENMELYTLLDITERLNKTKKYNSEHISNPIKSDFMFSLPFITEQHIKSKIQHKCQKDLCVAF